ncbi:hypothetical protein HOG48_00280 [Candidatus Peregrinibacteria bacterium]|jgi:hypothetical protein|nr:hypothetical protein [Candidatus Peregrinibacteria bacterium]
MNFTQDFQKLLLKKPRYNVKQVQAENSEFADTAIKSKNCYYSFCVFYCEDVYYGRYSRKCTNCSGITFCTECQWCIESTDCINGYMLSYCHHCSNCSECSYCADCFGCTNCFGCIGLHQKQYYLFNEKLSKEEYERKISELDLSNPAVMNMVAQKLQEVQSTTVNLGIHQTMTENCIGNNLSEAKNCYQCYDAFNLEDCLYNIECNGNKDCCDMTVCFEAENCYSCVQAPINYNCNFLMHTDQCSDSELCAYSKNLKNCFGCVYLENKEYHILNQPYPEDQYHAKVAEIKKELQSNGLYNMMIYFISDYEMQRYMHEEDHAIQPLLPTLN